MKREILDLIAMFGIYLQRHFTALYLLDKKKSFILDVGCGDGIMSTFLKRCGKKVIAMDIIKTKRKSPYVIANVENLPFKRNMFDQVVCLDVIEHVKREKILAKEIGRVLKVKGDLVLTTSSNFWKFPYYNFMSAFTPSEKTIMKFFGHLRKGYSIQEIKEIFNNFDVNEYRYYTNRLAALAYDIEYSNLKIVKNILLRLFSFFLYVNYKLSRKNYGTHVAVKMTKL